MTTRRLVGAAILIALAAAPALGQVSYSRLLNADDEPEAWLTYSGNYKSERFSRLDQINKENVSRLRPAWIYQTGTVGRVEVTPLVADGVMYIAEPPSTIAALDAHTGPAPLALRPDRAGRDAQHRLPAHQPRDRDPG